MSRHAAEALAHIRAALHTASDRLAHFAERAEATDDLRSFAELLAEVAADQRELCLAATASFQLLQRWEAEAIAELEEMS